jgi:hypothetical protein
VCDLSITCCKHHKYKAFKSNPMIFLHSFPPGCNFVLPLICRRLQIIDNPPVFKYNYLKVNLAQVFFAFTKFSLIKSCNFFSFRFQIININLCLSEQFLKRYCSASEGRVTPSERVKFWKKKSLGKKYFTFVNIQMHLPKIIAIIA